MLPVEMLATIISFCDETTWVHVCLVSKLFREMALPLLYKQNYLYEPRKLVLFLKVLMVNRLAAESVRRLDVAFDNRIFEENLCLSAFYRLISKALPRAVNLLDLYLRNGSFGSQEHLVQRYFYAGAFPKLRGVDIPIPFTRHIEEFIYRHQTTLQHITILPFTTPNHNLVQGLLVLELPHLRKLQVCSSIATSLLKNWSMPLLRLLSVFWNSDDSPSCEGLISALAYRLGAERSPNMFEFEVFNRPGRNLDLVRLALKLPFLTNLNVSSGLVSSAGWEFNWRDLQAVQNYLAVSPRVKNFQWTVFNIRDIPLDLDQQYAVVQSYGASCATLSECSILNEIVRWKRISTYGWLPWDDAEPQCFYWIFLRMSSGAYAPWVELLDYLHRDISGGHPSTSRYVLQFEEAVKRQSDERYDATMNILAILVHLRVCFYDTALKNGNYMVGWGQNPYFSEHDPEGDILYSVIGDVQAYRVFRYN